jgi:hypothetical protein
MSRDSCQLCRATSHPRQLKVPSQTCFLVLDPQSTPGNPQLSDPIVLVLLQLGVDVGSPPPKMLPHPVPRRPGALLALPVDRGCGERPNALASLTQSLPAPSAVLAQASL